MSKLSKSTKKKNSQLAPDPHDDDSDDDFVSPKATRQISLPAAGKKERERKSGEVLWSCPLCGRRLEESQQSSHLKQCGARAGLDTEQLVEVRRLEERHRQERLGLGLPEVLPPTAARKPTGRKKAAKPESSGAGADPDLELALALSISSCPAGSERPERPGGSMWLPQAPAPARRRGRQKKEVGRVLQARTTEERERLVGEKVAAVLEKTSVSKARGGPGSSSAKLWSLAARLDRVRPGELEVAGLREVMTDSNVIESQSSEETRRENTELAGQWLSLLDSGKESDVTVICSDLSLACHRLVLLVRCPSVLTKLVSQTDTQGRTSYLLLCDKHSGATVRRALRWLYGGLERCDGQVSSLLALWGVSPNHTDKGTGTESVTEINTKPTPESRAESVTETDGESSPVAGTQCLDNLIHCIDNDEDTKEVTQGDSNNDDEGEGENVIENSVDSDWEEMCDFMTQRKMSEMSQSQSRLDNHQESERDPEPSVTTMTVISRSSSPDMFESSDNECDEDQVLVSSPPVGVGGVKRKTESEGEGQKSSKILCRSFDYDQPEQEVFNYHSYQPEEEQEVVDHFDDHSEKELEEFHDKEELEEVHDKEEQEFVDYCDPLPDRREEKVIDLTQRTPTPPADDLVNKLSDLSCQLLEPDLSDTEIISLLVQLAVLEVTVPALLQTGAGKVVRRLKDREGKVGRLASRLVVRWKKVVLNYRPPVQEEEEKKSNEEEEENKADRSRDILNQTGLGQDINEDCEGVNGRIELQDDQELPNISDQGLPDISDQELPDIPDQELPEIPDQNLPATSDQDLLDIPDQEYPHPDISYQELPDNLDQEYPNNSDQELPDISDQEFPDISDQDLPDIPEPDYDYYIEDEENIPPSKLQATPEPCRVPLPGPATYRTPVSKFKHNQVEERVVTPLPDYSLMLTPQLRAELRKFGLKAVPRRKACLLLNHIYDQTHPLVASEGDSSQDSQDSQDSHSQCPEESIHTWSQGEGEDQNCWKEDETLHTRLVQFVKQRRSLHQAMLLYDPVWLKDLHGQVKQAGIKCRMEELQDWLDVQCITYRAETNRNKRKDTGIPSSQV